MNVPRSVGRVWHATRPRSLRTRLLVVMAAVMAVALWVLHGLSAVHHDRAAVARSEAAAQAIALAAASRRSKVR